MQCNFLVSNAVTASGKPRKKHYQLLHWKCLKCNYDFKLKQQKKKWIYDFSIRKAAFNASHCMEFRLLDRSHLILILILILIQMRVNKSKKCNEFNGHDKSRGEKRRKTNVQRSTGPAVLQHVNPKLKLKRWRPMNDGCAGVHIFYVFFTYTFILLVPLAMSSLQFD